MNQPKYHVGDEVLVSFPKHGKSIHVIKELEYVRLGNTYRYWSPKGMFYEENIAELVNSADEPQDTDLDSNERALVLEEAERLINGQRANDYGSPQTNFGRIAKLWEPILGVQIKPTDVALMLTQLKIARLINSPAHRDSWIDAAGYVGLGAELAKDQS